MKTRISQTILTCILATSHAFQTSNTARPTTVLSMKQNDKYSTTQSIGSTRKAFLASLITSSIIGTTAANAEEEGFESIAARAASMAQTVEKEEAFKEDQFKKADADPRSAYDFSLPIKGEDVSFDKLIGQEFTETSVVVKASAEGEEDRTVVKKDAKVKAILVVNMKQDDPIARKNIPELISLASK